MDGSALVAPRVRPDLHNAHVKDPDYLPEDVLEWARNNRELLDLVVAELLRTGDWPTTTGLTRDLARQGRPLPLSTLLRDLPRPLGFVENHPGRIVLLLFGLRVTSDGQRLLDPFVALLKLGIERFQGPDDPPQVTRADLRSLLGSQDDTAERALGEIFLREAPFYGQRTGGPDDEWNAEVTDLVVTYWDVQTPDDYLRIRAQELAGASPHYGFIAEPAKTGPVEIKTSDPLGPDRDVFISHASEDKDAIARPLAEALLWRGYTVWYDEYELVLGNSLRGKIEHGLAHSRIGVVILSQAFFGKPWPERELSGLYARLVGGEADVLVPIWHGVEEQDILKFAPTLADLLAGDSSLGPDELADQIGQALRRHGVAPGNPIAPVPRQGVSARTSLPNPGGSAQRQPLGAIGFDMDSGALSATVLELVRDDDQIALKHLFNRAVASAREAVAANDIDSGLADLLDKLVCIAASLLMVQEQQWFDTVVEVLVRIYAMPGTEAEHEAFLYGTSVDPISASLRVWFRTLKLVYGLGALATRLESWRSIRTLTIQHPKRIGEYERNWLRHAIVMVARAGQFKAQAKEISLLSLAAIEVQRLGCLREDGAESNPDALLTSLAQFDVLSNIVSLDDTTGGGSRRTYPNFARFYQHRVNPIVVQMLEDAAARRELFSGDDASLAAALHFLGEQARQQGWMTDGFEGWDGTPVGEFIAANKPAA